MANPFVEDIAARVGAASGLAPAEVAQTLTTPPNPKMGDYCFPCFNAAKAQKRKPNEVAQELAAKLAEAAVAWEMLHKRQCEMKPLAFVGEFWRPLVTMMCPAPAAAAWCGGAVRLAADAGEAIRFFDEFFARPALA